MHGPILNLLFPNAPDGVLIFRVSALSIIFTVLEQTINGALQGIGKIMTPTVALLIGVAVKFILNIVLVPIKEIGAAGAALATAVCHAIAFLIGIKALLKNIKLDLTFSKIVLKPVLATLMMSICSYAVYLFLVGINAGKMATIISILVAVLVYVLAIISLKIFNKEEINMIPYGNKIYNILSKIGIYREV